MDKGNILPKSRRVIGSAALSLFYALAQVVGYNIEQYGRFCYERMSNYMQILGYALIFYSILYYGMGYLQQRSNRNREGRTGRPVQRWQWHLLWAVLVVVGFVVLLGVYPGYACYDFNEQMTQMQTQNFSARHPLLHTFLMTGMITGIGNWFGSLNIGGFFYCLLQMMLITRCFLWVLKNLHEMGMSKVGVYIGVVFYGLLPTNIMFLLCTTKDSLFTIALLCNLIYMKKVLRLGKVKCIKRKEGIGFLVTGLLACLMRNNMVYAYVVCMVLMIVLYRTTVMRVVCLMLGVIGSTILCNTILMEIVSADSVSTAELLSVPIQQLARVVDERGEAFLEPEELTALYGFIQKEGIEAYDPKISDPVKSRVNASGDAGVEFIKLWIRVGMKAPLTYIDATLANTYQAWYPNALVDGYCEAVSSRYDTVTSYFSADVEAPLSLESKIPAIHSFFWNISRNGMFQTVPVVKYLFSIGAYLWLLLLAFVYAFIRKKRDHIVLLGLLLLFCGTSLLGPIVLVRYYLILFWAAPLIVYTLLEKENHSQTVG